MYSDLFWEHARHPRNRRSITDSLVGEARFHRCGDRLALYLKLDGENIVDIGFQGAGCAPVLAVASLATETIRGMTVEAALRLNIFELDRELGGIPPSKRHAYLIFLECLHNALRQHTERTNKS